MLPEGKHEDKRRWGDEMALINRWYQLLQQFMTHDRLSLNELQKITDTSPQTTKKTIQLLNDQMEHIAMIKEIDQIYSLKIMDSKQFSEIMNGSLKQQTDFNSSTKRIAVLIALCRRKAMWSLMICQKCWVSVDQRLIRIYGI